MKEFSRKIILTLLVGMMSLGITTNAQQQGTTTEKALSLKQQSIVSIAALTATGNLEDLKPALNDGLDAGLTINEIQEIIIHLYAYAGFPRSIHGLQTFMTVLDERKAKGLNDKVGPEASTVTNNRSKYVRGKENLEKLTGKPLEGPNKGYAAFAPTIEVFLKEHLFADIFERDVLNYQQRELVTVSVLAALGGVEPFMRSHMDIALYQGVTSGQLEHLVDLIEENIGEKEADAAEQVLEELLKSK
ncbi:carboxymuconolactone decarboxylase [Antarcticibacterium flavum]|uniref:Carboxymuconolactone decarboxylase n=1 Tax=Antarcticibacterium flavum TaxID=2058175 RepID=A0A5B7X6D9_9FLAO|nr:MULTISPECIES: carboxymuconolactone decarboxylase family protein [Antarcticibacterium]MCM4158557.1 carboxymuconolactone decarboxylase [Antarcticibacterium sp. W02-3]QCY70302.1 carboxymuconolactone decarboxylase [Antarcticibacterium flavum]